MRTRRRLPPLLAAAAILLAGWPRPADAGNTGNLQVDVVDPNGAAVAGARVLVTDPQNAAFSQETLSDRRGRAVLAGLTPKALNFRIEKEGYQAYESNFLAHAGDTEKKKVTIYSLDAALAGAGGGAAVPGATVGKEVHPWAIAFNEAVPFYREDKDEEAMSKLDAALKLKPDYAPAMTLKGTIFQEHGRCDEGIPLLKQAYALDPNSRGGLGPLILCLEGAGLKDEAETYRKIQSQVGRPKTDLYNEAVADINKGDDAAAAPLLELVLKQDETFAPAVYQYGLILFRRGDVAGAASKLEAYLKLAPGGEFAADARDLLTALKP